ncbi:unnamed protein product [Calicophoron daubneyi]|uniref:RING-type domain-containing protein n=1 Tax=Calicophoron daubneyi TaxID=300641 RepID=A0AAV2TID6_CALDB
MGNCFGIFGGGSQLLDNVETDDSNGEDTQEPRGEVTTSTMPVFHPHPGLNIPASRLTEEEQVQIVKRMDMIQFLPSASYIPASKDKLKECIICMCELKLNDEVRYLPCLHTFHRTCIDDWLMRSFVCPTCLRPIEVDVVSGDEKNGVTNSQQKLGEQMSCERQSQLSLRSQEQQESKPIQETVEEHLEAVTEGSVQTRLESESQSSSEPHEARQGVQHLESFEEKEDQGLRTESGHLAEEQPSTPRTLLEKSAQLSSRTSSQR